ncbi:MAG: hypothetical protein JWO89_2965 [Verrucomicrobiaceae bacterium]|nr:hypothetical protein [Verrucomicrobiaceae bacterium]
MLLPLKVFLISTVGCLFLVGCTDQASIEKAKALEAELEQISRLNSQAQAAMKRLDSKVEAARQENARLKEENAKLQESLESKGREMEKFKKDFENYKLQYKLGMRTRAPGMRVDDFSVDGTVYHNVVFKEMTDAAVTITHDNGVRKLELTQLPESLRDRLGLNIVVEDVNEKAELSVKKTAATINAEHQIKVNKTEGQKVAVIEELNDARRKLDLAKQEMILADAVKTRALTKAIQEQEVTIGKLQSKLTQAEVSAYQARQERDKLRAK